VSFYQKALEYSSSVVYFASFQLNIKVGSESDKSFAMGSDNEENTIPTTNKKRRSSKELEHAVTLQDIYDSISNNNAEISMLRKEQFTKLETMGKEIGDKIDGLNKDIKDVSKTVGQHTGEIAFLRRKMNEVDQDKLETYMEISGLKPENVAAHKADPKAYAISVISGLKINFDHSSILRAFIKVIKSTPKQNIVVIFRNFESKITVMKQKREHQGADSKSIFFEHHLTPFTRALYMEARKTARNKGWKIAFIKYGRVFMLKSDNEKALKINSFEDFDKIKE
jgi:hypothetical protein